MTPWTMGLAIWQVPLAATKLQMDLMRLAVGAPVVMAQRVTKAAREAHEPAFAFDPEWQRMVMEKAAATLEAQRQLWLYAFRAQSKPFDLAAALGAAGRSVRPYGRKVAANVKRLAR